MRHASDELHRLIKSLTMSEKIYFKRASSLHIIGSANKYIKLFDVIDSQQRYDEEKVKQAFGNDRFINNFHVAKRYLYNSILKSLRQFHSENLLSVKINNMLHDALILYRKMLFNESHTVLNKCKELIYKHNAYDFLFPLLKMERYLLSSRTAGMLLTNTGEMKEAVKKMNNITAYTELTGEFFSGRREIILRKENESEFLKNFFTHPLLAERSNAEAPESKTLLNKLYFNYYLALADDKKAFACSKETLKMLEADEAHKNEYIFEYINVIKSLLDSILFLKNYDEAAPLIKKLSSIEAASVYAEEEIFFIIAGFKLTMYIQTGGHKKGLAVHTEIEKRVSKSISISAYLTDQFKYAGGYLYLLAGKYDKALQCFNKILNKPEAKVRPDLLNFTHLLSLITHLELNNMELLRYSVNNTYRFLSKRRVLYKTEREVLEFLKKSPVLITKGRLAEGLRNLKERLTDITRDPYEKIALDYFDFISWIESKLGQKTFADIVKTKSKKKN